MPQPADRRKLIDFMMLMDRFKLIERRSYVGGTTRRETDAEHTWHTALLAMVLHSELASQINLPRALELIIVHDIPEILAGDTFAYTHDPQKGARESEAARSLFADLPNRQHAYLIGCWQEFEEGQTSEARFAHCMDRLQGFCQQIITEGRAWREEKITREMTRNRTRPIAEFDSSLRDLLEDLYEIGDSSGLWHSEAGRP